MEAESEESEELGAYHIQVAKQRPESLPPIKVQIGVDDCLVSMEVDTGASNTIMAETTYQRLWPGRSLWPDSQITFSDSGW